MIADLSEEKKEISRVTLVTESAAFPTSSDFSLVDSPTNSLNHKVIFV